MKGFVFTMDVLIGLSLIVMIILTLGIMQFESILPEKGYEKLSYITNDLIDALSYLEVRDIQDKPTVSDLIKKGVLTERDLDKSVLDLIASFWYTDNKTIAWNITSEVLEGVLGNLCINLTVDGQTIYNSTCNLPMKDVAVATRIESGYEPGRPVYGYIARAFLTSIRGKRDSSYAYFGGYVGDGNITKIINLPNFDKIIEAYMELDAGNNFTLSINGNPSGFYVKGSAGGGNMTADKWVVCNETINPSYCQFFNQGDNIINLKFTGNRSFIGGGYFRVTYNTTQMAPEEFNTTRYYFPGIYGLINLYDSFYVPGDLNSMQIHLHYWSNYTVYLTIGNTQVYTNDSAEVIDVNLNNATLSSILNYSELSKKTVPIRMGTAEYVLGGPGATGNADVILITDVSGSMIHEINSSETGVNRNCDDPNLYSPTTRRISLARCLDKEFVDIILNVSGNRVGLVSFSSNLNNYHNLSTNKTSLTAQIDNYGASGGTCICCGINQAYNILNTQSNSSRQKFVIVMTDGIAQSQCASNCRGNGTTGSSSNCNGWECCCSADPVTGSGCDLSLGSPCRFTGCAAACRCDCEMQNANYSSCRVHNDLNATVHSVGFGPVVRCSMGNWTLRSMAQCGNGSYYGSDNATELENIYKSIAESIVSISYVAQLIEISGNVSMNNTLYTDSYIELNYTPTGPVPEYGEISVTRETERLGQHTGNTVDTPYKEGWFNVSQDVKVVDAKITSYSSEYWTDRLYVSNSSGVWNRVYWLADYSSNYRSLGDPYIVQIPADLISAGNNSVRIGTGLGPNNATGGSPDDRVIYTMRFKASVDYGDVFNSSEFANQDAIQRLIDKTGSYVNITMDDVSTAVQTISGIRWLWGPSLLKIVVWER